MKKSALLMTSALAVVAAGTATAADRGPNWYVSAAAGANWLNDGTSFTTTFFTVSGSPTETLAAELEYDTGWAVAAAVGYKFESPFRIELELSGRWNDFDAAANLNNEFFLDAEGDVEALGALVNFIWDAKLSDRWSLSLGAGAGWGRVDVEADVFASSTAGPSTTAFTVEGDDSGFAYQGLAELAYQVGEKTDLFLGYRYFVVTDVDPLASGSDEDYEAHTALLGLRYHFVEAAPAPTPAPTPVAGCAQQTFLVFFDFNKANLTADAAGVVAEAAAAYKAGCSVVLVVGHTDTVGSMSYNQDLSERRAASVKAEMVNQGVPADAISTEGRSFTDPLVPTGPGVKEAQNRRAVISVQ